MATLDLGNVMGPQGPQGSIWYFGTDVTGQAVTGTVFSGTGIVLARQYDKYLNTSTSDIYTCTVEGDAETAEWVWIGNIKGNTGNIGPVGPAGTVDGSTPITFTEAENRANIESEEALGTIFGKIKKVFADLLIGAGSTLIGADLTASRALVSDANGKVGVSTITATELGYLDGVTKNIQAQLNELTGKTDKQMIIRLSETFSDITIDAGKAIDKSVGIQPPSGYSLVSEYFYVSGSGSNGLVVNPHSGSISIYSAYGCSTASVTHYMIFARDAIVTI